MTHQQIAQLVVDTNKGGIRMSAVIAINDGLTDQLVIDIYRQLKTNRDGKTEIYGKEVCEAVIDYCRQFERRIFDARIMKKIGTFMSFDVEDLMARYEAEGAEPGIDCDGDIVIH